MKEPLGKFAPVLERLKARKLTDDDYNLLIAELEKVVNLGTGNPPDAGGRRVVAKLPFGLDLVK